VALANGAVDRPRAAIFLPILAWVGVSILSALTSQNPLRSVAGLADLLTLVLVPMTVSLVDVRRWQRLLALLAVVATVSATVGLAQYARGASTLEHRLHGVATQYMTFAGWTLIVILLLLADMVFGRGRRRLAWTLPASALCSAALILGLTRGAWIGLAAGIGLTVAIVRPRLLILTPMAAATLILVLPSVVIERAASTFDTGQPSVRERIGMLHTGLAMVRDHPILGLGPEMVQPAYPTYRTGSAPRRTPPHLHNNLVQIAAERGLAGVAAYLAILVVFTVQAARALRDRSLDARAAIAGCLLAVTGVTVAGLFEYSWGDAEVWFLTLTCLATPFALSPAAPT
jgi:O-antigen ligase